MIYICERKSCQYLFDSDSPDICPDCGSKRIRPASQEEQETYYHYRQEFGYDEECSTVK